MIVRFLGLAFIAAVTTSSVYAQQGPAPQQPGIGQMLFQMLPMFILVYFIFYFLVTRPQEQKAKQHRSLLENLKRGDMVVTTGGIIGRVAGIEKDYILLEVSNNVKIKVERLKIGGHWQAQESQATESAKKKEVANK
jgi:preprotein translocase subunit YajC